MLPSLVAFAIIAVPSVSIVLARSADGSKTSNHHAAPVRSVMLAQSQSAPVPVSPAAVDAQTQAAPAPQQAPESGAVFDAPGMPGVRTMAPIPDSAPVAGNIHPDVSIASPADHAILQQAFAAAASRDWDRALDLAGQASNPVGRLIIEWRYLLDETSGAMFESIVAFLNAHPNWPRHDALMIRAEKTMPDLDPKDVIAWYGNRTPLSGTGMIRLGDALMQSGRREGAALIRKGWIEFTFSPFDENDILAKYGDILGPAEQKARLNRLLAHEDIGGAKRQMARVDGETQRLADARLKLKANPANVNAILASLPPSDQADPEFLFDAARALRRRGSDEDAWVVMEKAPTNKDLLVMPERWSAERQVMARDALKAGEFDLAYRLASTPVLESTNGASFMDAEFLAGWITLRFLHKPELATAHFERLAKGVTYPISVARAHYWMGRAAEAMNQTETAAAEYRKAAEYPATFYGQLALAKVAESPVLHMTSVSAQPTPAARAAFETDDRVQAIHLLAEFGDRNTMRQFANSIAAEPANPERLQLLAQVMADIGDKAMSVRVAKTASYSGYNLVNYLHPVMALPQVADAPEAALVLGIARQESEFDPTVVSGAGARGLMQLMPASAKRAANMSGLPYRLNELTTNPSYNIQLGMATLNEYLARWDGSYILAIATYNAGPANVERWVEIYGDPRDPQIDPIDWIESIPYPETRNYVQRVLENLEVYRNRLSNSDRKLGIVDDLYRPRTAGLPVTQPLSAKSAAATR